MHEIAQLFKDLERVDNNLKQLQRFVSKFSDAYKPIYIALFQDKQKKLLQVPQGFYPIGAFFGQEIVQEETKYEDALEYSISEATAYRIIRILVESKMKERDLIIGRLKELGIDA